MANWTYRCGGHDPARRDKRCPNILGARLVESNDRKLGKLRFYVVKCPTHGTYNVAPELVEGARKKGG